MKWVQYNRILSLFINRTTLTQEFFPHVCRKKKKETMAGAGATASVIAVFLVLLLTIGRGESKRLVIEEEGSPNDLVWVVQLSDLHFSVHHPQRAQDFTAFVGPALSFIKPSLVLLTGDLTGLSSDLDFRIKDRTFSELVLQFFLGFMFLVLILAQSVLMDEIGFYVFEDSIS